MQCTWESCEAEATTPQYSVDKSVWANLCPAHAIEIDTMFDDFNAAKCLRLWIKAHGGPKKLASKMVG